MPIHAVGQKHVVLIERGKRELMPASFGEVLAENPHLKRVDFYQLTCGTHGIFRMLANGVVRDCCPRCGLPAKLVRSRSLRCATRLDVPLVQRWKSDNLGAVYNASPSRIGGIEDC